MATPYSQCRCFLIGVIIQLHAHNSHNLLHILHILFTRLCLTMRANLLCPICLASPVPRKMLPRSCRHQSPLSSPLSVSHSLLENGPVPWATSHTCLREAGQHQDLSLSPFRGLIFHQYYIHTQPHCTSMCQHFLPSHHSGCWQCREIKHVVLIGACRRKAKVW